MNFVDLHDLASMEPDIEYLQAAPAAHGAAKPPGLLAGPVPAEFETWFYGDRWGPAAGLFSLKNLRLSGDMTLQWQGQTLAIPQNEIHAGNIRPPIEPATGKHRRIEEKVVLLSGAAYRIYGHWLVDFLPRLHILTLCGHDLSRLRFLLPTTLPLFARVWLSLLGIRSEQVIPYDITTDLLDIAHALIPTNLRGYSRANPVLAGAMEALVTRLRRPPVSAGRKIFVSRRNWGNQTRRLANAEAIETIFQQHGFEIVCPEQSPLPAQIQLFQSSTLIAGEYGSGLHNAIFAPPGATILALRGTLAHPYFLQSGLCEIKSQTCAYVFGATETIGGHQVFSVDEADLKTALKALGI